MEILAPGNNHHHNNNNDNNIDNNDKTDQYQEVEAEKPGRQAAVDLYELKVCSRVMAAWVEFTRDERRRQYGHVMKAIVFQRRQEPPIISLLIYY